MCCGGKMCMLCSCLVLTVIAIGLVFGFGVFKNAFHKFKDTIHVDGFNSTGRPFLGYYVAPPPPVPF